MSLFNLNILNLKNSLPNVSINCNKYNNCSIYEYYQNYNGEVSRPMVVSLAAELEVLHKLDKQ